MSFRTSSPVSSSAFDLLRHSLSPAEGLPFTEALTAEQIEQAFDAEGVSFAGEGNGGHEPVYTPAVTLWAMLSQGVFTAEQRSFRAAVIRVAAYLILSEQPHPKLGREGFSPSPEHQQRLDHEFRTLFPALDHASLGRAAIVYCGLPVSIRHLSLPSTFETKIG